MQTDRKGDLIMNDNIVISAKNIHKTFGKGETAQKVLEGASLEIEKGSFVSLVGESGSGKSTLLYLIGGLDRDFQGDIFVAGQNVAKLDDKALSSLRCRSMGFVFQFYNLAANLNVEDNILLPIEMSGRRVSDYREKYEEILEITGLTAKRKSFPNQLSGGQQQRVSIARAIINDPSILLADEPTGNLDTKATDDIVSILKMTNKTFGQTILMITHNMEIAKEADRIIHIRDGKIVEGV